jgi:hypothetical protein
VTDINTGNINTFTQVGSWPLPAGNWVFVATVEVDGSSPNFNDTAGTAGCELRDNSGGKIGGARGGIPPVDTENPIAGRTTMTFNGGTVNPPGGQVSMWCAGGELTSVIIESGQVLAMQVGGFF